jgi:hypothetical protein
MVRQNKVPLKMLGYAAPALGAIVGSRLYERAGNYFGKDPETYKSIPSYPWLGLPSSDYHTHYQYHPETIAVNNRTDKLIEALHKLSDPGGEEANKLMNNFNTDNENAMIKFQKD